MNFNLPQDFINLVSDQLGDELEQFSNSLNSSAPTSIRINTQKHSFSNETPIAWVNNGFYLIERPSFVADPLFHAGCYYPQEASSMFLDEVLRQLPLPDQPFILDLCAAPGGKSTLILSFLNQKGLLVCNEVIKPRAEILNENITKWGYSNTIVTNNDPSDFERLKLQFDCVVVDAPCSGEGMFRKDANAINEWSLDNVNLCSGRQKRILADIESSVKPGGYLIYSTCTYNKHEDEENIDWLINEYDYKLVGININNFTDITKTENGYKFFPHKIKGEGFFIAVLKKSEKSPEKSIKKVKRVAYQLIDIKTHNIQDWLIPFNSIGLYQIVEQITAFPSDFKLELETIASSLNIVSAGTLIAEITRKGLNPTHELSQSLLLNKGAFPIIEVKQEDAIKYLRKDNISANGNVAGFNLITFKEKPLGWVKNLGNRLNNYYPKHWRIRKEI